MSRYLQFPVKDKYPYPLNTPEVSLAGADQIKVSKIIKENLDAYLYDQYGTYRFNDLILFANKIQNPNFLRIGQTLYLPRLSALLEAE